MFFSPFDIAVTSLGEERANLSAFRTFVRFALVWFCLFPLPLGVWEGLRFVIVALPGLLSYLFCKTNFVLFFRLRYIICVLLKAIPISSDQGTELLKVGVDPILLSLWSLFGSRVCLTIVMSVTFRIATFGMSYPWLSFRHYNQYKAVYMEMEFAYDVKQATLPTVSDTHRRPRWRH